MTDKHRYRPGQRWASDTESDLGLGLVSAVDERTVTLVFPASEQQRTYAVTNAPLSRVHLNPGQTARSGYGWEMKVVHVHERDGLAVYEGVRSDTGETVRLPEAQLDGFLQVADAKSRLFNAQTDPNKWFDLRAATYGMIDRVQGTSCYGLAGVRIDLIPHQLFIAQEIGSRFAPRALLADEVGLGKTIEACLVMHKQLLTGRAARVLIIVPESLLHQWLVELVRRFNLKFKVFDEQRCSSTQELDPDVNPFDTEQLILVPLRLFDSEQRRREALAASWDLVIIDEAHHLQWNQEKPSPLYLFAADLTARVAGVLLLTATPEQLGERSHFARLRLLDPDRFTDFDSFMQEQRDYRRVSEIVDELTDDRRAVSASGLSSIAALLKEEVTVDGGEQRQQVIRKLIDRHGPSRVLFRNTRTNIRGFPQRLVFPEPLPMPAHYPVNAESLERAIYPESSRPGTWASFDPRVTSLIELLARLPGQKILVICARSATVVDLEHALRTRHGVHSAMFHEQMSLVARDRAAHYFADPVGARILLCSEIGSEGRNFQFARHLVLFDLPPYPDLLEQRIGRLDRIGQRSDVSIHIPHLDPGGQAVLFHWYQDGLDAFRSTCAVGQSVFDELEPELLDALRAGSAGPELIDLTRRLHRKKMHAVELGRDRLLEISSFDRSAASRVVESIERTEATYPVRDYMERVFDMYGVEFEDRSETTYVLRPSERMQNPYFPSLKADGVTATFDRTTALAHEDVEFLTWEHPMTLGAMDMVVTGDHGKTAVIGTRFPLLPSGTVLIETVHVLELIAPNAADLRRFLGPATRRFLTDENGRNLNRLVGSSKLLNEVQDIEPALAKKLVRMKREKISTAIEQVESEAQKAFRGAVEQAKAALADATGNELERLEYLQSVNASVRCEELELTRRQLELSLGCLDEARPRLDAVRLIGIV